MTHKRPIKFYDVGHSDPCFWKAGFNTVNAFTLLKQFHMKTKHKSYIWTKSTDGCKKDSSCNFDDLGHIL